MLSKEDHQTEASVVAALVAESHKPIHFTERKGVVVMPNGSRIDLEDERFADTPKRQRASVDLYNAQSFVDYLNAHKRTSVTHVFGQATEAGGSFLAVVDYHEIKNGPAGWGEHKVSLKLATTPEWSRWLGNNNKLLAQEPFAEFIEDNMADIVQPDGGILIDAVQFLQGTKNVSFKAGKSLRNGSMQIEYTEVIDAQAGTRRDDKTTLPETLTVLLSPFVGVKPTEIKARLRFRLGQGGGVSFQYVLDRPYKVLEQAFNDAAALITEKTGLTVHFGSAQVIAPVSPDGRR